MQPAPVAVPVVDDEVVLAHEQFARDAPALESGAATATGTSRPRRLGKEQRQHRDAVATDDLAKRLYLPVAHLLVTVPPRKALVEAAIHADDALPDAILIVRFL